MSDEFLDDYAIRSNEQSTISIARMMVVLDSHHPSLPHAAALCIETGKLMVIGRVGNVFGIAFWRAIPDAEREMLVRERRLTFKNTAYVQEILGAKKSRYKKETQLPVTIYSNQAQILSLHYLKEYLGGKFLYSIELSRKSVKMPLVSGESIDIFSPMMRGELMIEMDIPSQQAQRVTYSGSEILIEDQRADLRDIDYALLATMSRIEW